MSSSNETLYVSSRHLGLIIGKGGSRIKELSEEHNCRINIKKDEVKNDEVPIVIEGDSRDVDSAKSAIKDITRRNAKRHHDEDDERSNRSFSSNDYDNKRSSRNNDFGRDNNRRGDDYRRRDENDNQREFKRNDNWNSNSRDGDRRGGGGYNENNRNDRDGGRRGGGYNESNWRNGGNNDNWGAWGDTKAEEQDSKALVFDADDQFNSFTRYIPQSADNYIPDDDWGIPTGFEEEKPVRKRPENANLKMRSSKDKSYYPVIKNFYHEHPDVKRMTTEEKNAFLLAKNNIMIKEIDSEEKVSFSNFGNSAFEPHPEELIEEIPVPKKVPNPIRTFEEAFFNHPDILDEIYKQGFREPSPIQCISWPILMLGRDFIGIAQTGTGKTLAFLLPAFIHIEGQQKSRESRQGPTVLILSPTRELAIQIQNEVQKYTYHDIDSVVCYGGSDKREQIYQLKDNPEIVVGTPGRIQDLKDSGVLNLKDVSYLVLDEADRMLDMGFEIQVVNLIYSVRKQRQTVMTSATWPFGVQRIALTHMKDPVQVNVGTLDLNACHSVTQYVEKLHEQDKMERLCEILCRIEDQDKIIIFVGKKTKCGDLSYELLMKRSAGQLGGKRSVRACEIHGDLDQQEREVALRMMRKGERNVMIATDVASRGLDISDLTKVINYDFPRNIEEYVHRVGRTGRAGRSGESYTFMNYMDAKHACELIRILEDANQDVPDFLPDLVKEHQENRLNGGGRFGGGGGRGGRGRGGRGGGFRGDRDRGGRGGRGGNDDEGFFGGFGGRRSDDVSSDNRKQYMEEDIDDDEYWGNWSKKKDDLDEDDLLDKPISLPKPYFSDVTYTEVLSCKWDTEYEEQFKKVTIEDDYDDDNGVGNDDNDDDDNDDDDNNDDDMKDKEEFKDDDMKDKEEFKDDEIKDNDYEMKDKDDGFKDITQEEYKNVEIADIDKKNDTKHLFETANSNIHNDNWTSNNDTKPTVSNSYSFKRRINPYIIANKDRNLYPIHKSFYKEHPETAALTAEEIEKILLSNNNIMIQEMNTYPMNYPNNSDADDNDDDVNEDDVELLSINQGIPKPIQTFQHAFWQHEHLLNIIDQLGFKQPTPIQSIGWPSIMGGRDFIGIAQTGTGKTLTFVLPALLHICGQVKPLNLRRGPTVLILSPTRELAIQIETEIDKVLAIYNKQLTGTESEINQQKLRCCCCYGGSDKQYQIAELRNYPAIIVGTPGRLNDLVEMGYLHLKDVSYLVLDEADRMLDMGFEQQIVSLIYMTRRQRQTVMTSATWPQMVQTIALLYMNQPIQVNVGSFDLIACEDVDQQLLRVENTHKTEKLCDILYEMSEKDKIIVFVTRKVQCRSLASKLNYMINNDQLGTYAAVDQINGDMSQEAREYSLNSFRDGFCNVLIATNVASRGLDISDITTVVNYDFPKDIEEYVHRVGRTGRAGKKGKAITFMNDDDHRHAMELRKILLKSNQQVPDWLTDLRSVRPCQEYREYVSPTDYNYTNNNNKSNSRSYNPSSLNIDNIKNEFNFNYSDNDFDYADNDYCDDGARGFFDDFQQQNDPDMEPSTTSGPISFIPYPKQPGVYGKSKRNRKKKSKPNNNYSNFGRGRSMRIFDELFQDNNDDDDDDYYDGDFFDEYQFENDPEYELKDEDVINLGKCNDKKVENKNNNDDDDDNEWRGTVEVTTIPMIQEDANDDEEGSWW